MSVMCARIIQVGHRQRVVVTPADVTRRGTVHAADWWPINGFHEPRPRSWMMQRRTRSVATELSCAAEPIIFPLVSDGLSPLTSLTAATRSVAARSRDWPLRRGRATTALRADPRHHLRGHRLHADPAVATRSGRGAAFADPDRPGRSSRRPCIHPLTRFVASGDSGADAGDAPRSSGRRRRVDTRAIGTLRLTRSRAGLGFPRRGRSTRLRFQPTRRHFDQSCRRTSFRWRSDWPPPDPTSGRASRSRLNGEAVADLSTDATLPWPESGRRPVTIRRSPAPVHAGKPRSAWCGTRRVDRS